MKKKIFKYLKQIWYNQYIIDSKLNALMSEKGVTAKTVNPTIKPPPDFP